MNKAEILRIATYLRTTYQTLKGCIEGRDERCKGFKYIPLELPFEPSDKEVKELADYLLENEDRGLYDKTFGMMDRDLISSIYWKLDDIKCSWDNEILFHLIDGNKSEVKKLCGEDFLYIVGVYDLWKLTGAVISETALLQPIFKNLIPPLNQSVSCQENHFCEKYIIIPRKESLKKKLHELIDETKGRKSVLPIYTSVDMGLILKPKYKDFIAEFGKIISESEYSKAFNDPKFSDEEIRNMVLKLSGFKQ